MSITVTGAHSGQQMSVDLMVKDPLYIPNQIATNLTGAFLEEALFRYGGNNNGSVVYYEALPTGATDGPEIVAEGAEIPVTTWNHAEARVAMTKKVALGAEITAEMIQYNRIDQVAAAVQALQQGMASAAARDCLDTLAGAETLEVGVTRAWSTGNGDPVADVQTAIGVIADATGENGGRYGYNPDTIVLSRATLQTILGSENIQKFYSANKAEENPIYKGILTDTLLGLKVITSPWVKPGEVYVMEAGRAGFYSDATPLTVSQLYSRNGDNGHGGSNQTWRVDAFRSRLMAVDNPKAVARISGATE